MRLYLQMAVRNLWQAKKRSAVLGGALVVVSMFLTLLLAFGNGLSASMLEAATTLSSGHVNVAGFYKRQSDDASPIVLDKDKVRALIRSSIPGVELIVDRTRGWARIISETDSLNAGLNGIDIDQEVRFLDMIQLAPESDYVEGGSEGVLGNLEDLKKPRQVLIFATQAKRLGVGVGDGLTITVETLRGARMADEFTVAAVAKDVGFMSGWSIFAHQQSINALYDLKPSITGVLQLYLDDHRRAVSVMGRLREVFADAGYTLMEHDPQPFWMKFEKVAGEDWLGQRIDLTVWSDEIAFLLWVLTAVDTISYSLAAILMLIISIGIMNSLWISVRERTTEVGTLRAIGMGRRRVLWMFLSEALVLGAVATTLGTVLGAGTAAGVDALDVWIPAAEVRSILMSETFRLLVKPGQLFSSVVSLTLIAGVAAAWPAYRATKLQPVTAIHISG